MLLCRKLIAYDQFDVIWTNGHNSLFHWPRAIRQRVGEYIGTQNLRGIDKIMEFFYVLPNYLPIEFNANTEIFMARAIIFGFHRSGHILVESVHCMYVLWIMEASLQ